MEKYEVKELPYKKEEANSYYWGQLDTDDPLLEYVTEWAAKFCPSYDEGYTKDPNTGKEGVIWYQVPSRTPNRFVARFLREEVDCIEECRNRYIEAKELLAMLDAFSIDKDKFWYLCLALKDYIEGYANGTKNMPTHSDILKEFIEKLDEMEPNVKKQMWMFGTANHKARLTLKVDGTRKSFTTDDTTVLNIINYALTNFYHNYCTNENSIFNTSFISSEKAKFTTTDKAFLFYQYMSVFLKDKKCKRGTEVSKSKDLLISRALYVFEIILVPKEKFYDYDGMGNRALRDMIKNCPDPTSKSDNKYYMFT